MSAANDTTTTAPRWCVRMGHADGMGGRSHSFMVRINASDASEAGRVAEQGNPGHRAYEVQTEQEWGAQ